jgi:hypothetical protein
MPFLAMPCLALHVFFFNAVAHGEDCLATDLVDCLRRPTSDLELRLMNICLLIADF